MFKLSRNQIAALLSIAGLAILAAVAMGAQNNKPATLKAKGKPVLVRTVVVRRTVHVTRHLKPKQSAAKPKAASASPPSPAAVKISSPAQPSSSPGSKHAPASKPKPVQSSTSGYGGGGENDDDDDEKENEHDDDENESEDDD